MKFSGKVDNETTNRLFNFGGDPDQNILGKLLGGGLRSPSAFLVGFGSFSMSTHILQSFLPVCVYHFDPTVMNSLGVGSYHFPRSL